MMKPQEIASIRAKLGMTQQELADTLLLGKGGDRTVRRWEAGERAISGPAIIAILALLSGWEPPWGAADNPFYKEPK